ncbi:Polygalacturonase [Sesamum angolense]|uniref:Polygalacturonase n=1 Tax=Sesamum angolense TaxID=2727404 RepID=A0AAE1X263_9LAMI|nr:Polygalacturonase [Sesamum angolense]
MHKNLFSHINDAKTDATQPFLRAWASACNSKVTSTIYVPKGRFSIRFAEFRGPCKSAINVQIDGTLIAPNDYRALGNPGYWILFIQVNRISVIGGALDAKGDGVWKCKKAGLNCPVQARVSNVKIIAPDDSPNTDGIHVQSSTAVTIKNSVIQTGDDCISIGPGTRNLWMEKIQCGPGHGVSIGSLGKDFKEDGVENVTLINSVFSGSDNGLRIKTWGRASKGFVRNIRYQNIVMRNVENPIIIDQNYCPGNQGCPRQSSGIKISEVSYQNIQGTSATPYAMVFDCSPTNPCRGIKLRDIKLTYLKTNKAQSRCKNVGGTSSGVILPHNCL